MTIFSIQSSALKIRPSVKNIYKYNNCVCMKKRKIFGVDKICPSYLIIYIDIDVNQRKGE
jgi:hypothetical protein